MRRFLVFRLFGPLAAWGEIAVGEIRPSALQPTRSALLGLLAAALGLERGDEPKHAALARAVRFGVQVESAGVPISDYHTAQVLPARRGRILATRADQVRGDRHELGTTLSRREYRSDASYRVAVWQAEPEPGLDLDRLAEALVHPTFTLYLGRKSCPPALPLGPRVIEASSSRGPALAARGAVPAAGRRAS